MKTKIIAGVDALVFETNLNAFLEKTTLKVKDIQYTVTAIGMTTYFTALIIFE